MKQPTFFCVLPYPVGIKWAEGDKKRVQKPKIHGNVDVVKDAL